VLPPVHSIQPTSATPIAASPERHAVREAKREKYILSEGDESDLVLVPSNREWNRWLSAGAGYKIAGLASGLPG
jgi:hypothetical protein